MPGLGSSSSLTDLGPGLGSGSDFADLDYGSSSSGLSAVRRCRGGFSFFSTMSEAKRSFQLYIAQRFDAIIVGCRHNVNSNLGLAATT